MSRYIDRDLLVDKLPVVDANCKKKITLVGAVRDFIEIIFDMPEVDVVEAKHGEWEIGHYESGIFDGTNFERCSICQFERLFEDINLKTTFSYCPNCGAKMDSASTL